MLKITALLTTLALGASTSIAMASPSRSFDRSHAASRTRVERVRVAYDHRLDRSEQSYRGWSHGGTADDFGPRRYRPTWVELSAPLQLARGPGWIDVTDRGTFTQLRLQSAGGSACVDRVIIQFADGSEQVANPGRVLDERGELLEIPLDGNNRRIDRIAVIGSGARGALQVFAI